MDVVTLVVAGIAAIASIVSAILTNRNRVKLQVSERRFAETMSLQPRRLELYASLVKVLRGQDRSLSFKSPSDLGGGIEGTRAAAESVFFDLANDSTQRLGEARTLVGQVRLVSSAEVVRLAQRCADALDELNRRWMVVLLELVKDKAKRDPDAVLEGVHEAQAVLTSGIEQLESVIRAEQGVEGN